MAWGLVRRLKTVPLTGCSECYCECDSDHRQQLESPGRSWAATAPARAFGVLGGSRSTSDQLFSPADLEIEVGGTERGDQLAEPGVRKERSSCAIIRNLRFLRDDNKDRRRTGEPRDRNETAGGQPVGAFELLFPVTSLLSSSVVATRPTTTTLTGRSRLAASPLALRSSDGGLPLVDLSLKHRRSAKMHTNT